MRLGHNQRLEEITLNADINESLALLKHDSQPSGVKWVDGLRSSVRPVITYASHHRCKQCLCFSVPDLWQSDDEIQALIENQYI
jgi:hypothetical protein